MTEPQESDVLTIEVQINLEPIAVIHVFNRGPVFEDIDEHMRAYEWVVATNDTHRPAAQVMGRLPHRRTDGALALVRKVMNEVGST